MRLVYFILLLFLMGGCSSTATITRTEEIQHYAAFEAPDFELISKTDVFSNSTVVRLGDEHYVEETGDKLLRQIIPAYADQVGGIEYADPEIADVIFRIKSVTVKRTYFTLNFPHPGPIYKVTMAAEIEENDGRIQAIKLTRKANMSEINYPNERFKTLNAEEKNDFDNQFKTINAALRQLYQQLYFQYFDISLQL